MSSLLAHPVVLLALGGGAGTVCRHYLGEWMKAKGWAGPFPWHTFVINVLGSFLLGLLAVGCRHRPGWYLLLGTGFCGGFTTFSTFSVETLQLLEKDRPGAAVGYVAGSVVAGLAGAWAGVRLVRG